MSTFMDWLSDWLTGWCICGTCKGTGWWEDDDCPTCKGTGWWEDDDCEARES